MVRESERDKCIEWWEEVMLLLRRLSSRFKRHLRKRKNGLLKLRHEVTECEYEDVHVMWEMLSKTDTGLARCPTKKQKKAFKKLILWTRSANCLCHTFSSNS